MRRGLLILTAVLTCLTGRAQQQHTIINGKITDEQGRPIAMANVVALNPPDSAFVTGTTSLDNGAFTLTVPPDRMVILQISFVGYVTQTLQAAPGSTLSIVLKEESRMLEEATVTATRPIYHLKGSTLTTDIRQTLLASSGTGRDVLKHIPGISVRDEAYEVFGKGTPQIYIDNRLVQDNAEIERLSSKDIEKIEVIRNPGAEYDATVKAVIRIRTTRNGDQGMSGYTHAVYTLKNQDDYGEQTNITYHHDKLTLFGNLWYLRRTNRRLQTNVYHVLSASNPTVNSRSCFLYDGDFFGGKMGMNYDFTPKQSAGFSIEPTRTPRNDVNDYAFYTAKKEGTEIDSIDYDSHTKLPSTSILANGFYEGEFNGWELNFTTDMLFNNTHTDQQVRETGTLSSVSDLLTKNRSDNRMIAAKLIVTHDLGKGSLKTGSDFTIISRKDNFISSTEILPTVLNKIDENKEAFFTEYDISFGKLSATAGLRYEHAATNYWKDGSHVAAQSKSYDDLLPNVSLDLPVGKMQTSLSYSIRKSRPSFNMLRSNLNYNNRYVYEGGNPLLIPATLHDVELNILYRWMQLSVRYVNYHNIIASDERAYENDPDVAVVTVDNYPRLQSLSSFLTLTPSIIGWWKPELNISYTQPFFTARYGNGTRQMNRGTFAVTLNQSITLSEDFILTIDAYCQSAGDNAPNHIPGNGYVDIGLRKSIFAKRFEVILQASDIFHTQSSDIDFYGTYLTIAKRAKYDSRDFSLALRYNFRASKFVYKGKHVSDNDIQRLK